MTIFLILRLGRASDHMITKISLTGRLPVYAGIFSGMGLRPHARGAPLKVNIPEF